MRYIILAVTATVLMVGCSGSGTATVVEDEIKFYIGSNTGDQTVTSTPSSTRVQFQGMSLVDNSRLIIDTTFTGSQLYDRFSGTFTYSEFAQLPEVYTEGTDGGLGIGMGMEGDIYLAIRNGDDSHKVLFRGRTFPDEVTELLEAIAEVTDPIIYR